MKIFKYQNKKNLNYFEGWYIRFSTKDNKNFAVIFALSKNKENPHSFIQVFKDDDQKCTYLSFDLNEFQYDYNNHIIHIGVNSLSLNKLIVKDKEINIDINFDELDIIENYGGSKSAMGYLSKAPLECFQEVIFLNAQANGFVSYKQIEYQINGKGYMEKTYGTNFPSKWIWLQSNHCEQDASFSFSVGLIPIGFLKPKGFLALLQVDNKLYRFYSGNFSKVKISETRNLVTIKKGKSVMTIIPDTNHYVELVGPRKKGIMDLPVFESLNSKAYVELKVKNKKVFSGMFTNVGYEEMFLLKEAKIEGV